MATELVVQAGQQRVASNSYNGNAGQPDSSKGSLFLKTVAPTQYVVDQTLLSDITDETKMSIADIARTYGKVALSTAQRRMIASYVAVKTNNCVQYGSTKMVSAQFIETVTVKQFLETVYQYDQALWGKIKELQEVQELKINEESVLQQRYGNVSSGGLASGVIAKITGAVNHKRQIADRIANAYRTALMNNDSSDLAARKCIQDIMSSLLALIVACDPNEGISGFDNGAILVKLHELVQQFNSFVQGKEGLSTVSFEELVSLTKQWGINRSIPRTFAELLHKDDGNAIPLFNMKDIFESAASLLCSVNADQRAVAQRTVRKVVAEARNTYSSLAKYHSAKSLVTALVTDVSNIPTSGLLKSSLVSHAGLQAGMRLESLMTAMVDAGQPLALIVEDCLKAGQPVAAIVEGCLKAGQPVAAIVGACLKARQPLALIVEGCLKAGQPVAAIVGACLKARVKASHVMDICQKAEQSVADVMGICLQAGVEVADVMRICQEVEPLSAVKITEVCLQFLASNSDLYTMEKAFENIVKDLREPVQNYTADEIPPDKDEYYESPNWALLNFFNYGYRRQKENERVMCQLVLSDNIINPVVDTIYAYITKNDRESGTITFQMCHPDETSKMLKCIVDVTAEQITNFEKALKHPTTDIADIFTPFASKLQQNSSVQDNQQNSSVQDNTAVLTFGGFGKELIDAGIVPMRSDDYKNLGLSKYDQIVDLWKLMYGCSLPLDDHDDIRFAAFVIQGNFAIRVRDFFKTSNICINTDQGGGKRSYVITKQVDGQYKVVCKELCTVNDNKSKLPEKVNLGFEMIFDKEFKFVNMQNIALKPVNN